MSSIRESQVYFTASTAKASLVLVPLLSFVGAGTQASAQVIPSGDGSSSTAVDVISDNRSMEERFDITGGQLSDDSGNLFQSFEKFDLSVDQTANFVTLPDVQNVIGKVSGGSASNIDGTLQVSGSDASLYLMNPAGVLMGPNAQLNLSGDFTATTSTSIEFESGEFWSAEDGHYSRLNGDPTGFHFEAIQPGAIVNLGDLSVEKGRAINLVGGTVVNTGELSAPEGTVTVTAVGGDRFVRMSREEHLLSLEVEASQLTAAGANRAIAPESIGEMLTGGEVSNATSLVTATDGSVWLGSEPIDESGGSAIISGSLSAVGERGGDINVLGDRINLTEATLDASGTTDGGLIRVGGDYQGQGTVLNAAQTNVDAGSSLLADSTTRGDGGNIIVWSDDTTDFYGSVTARGGLLGGNGGFAEVSGKASLNFRGQASLEAPAGDLGTLLLDPKQWVITDGSAPANTANVSYISRTEIGNISGNVSLSADDGITVEDLSSNKLMLKRDAQIKFIADADTDGIGSFIMNDSNDSIRSERSDIEITGAGISVGTLSTHTDEHDPGGKGNVMGGSVSLTSSQDIVAREILTYGQYNGNHHSGYGGDVEISAVGDIVVEKTIKTYSYVQGREAGDGGNINLQADGDIRIGNGALLGESVLFTNSTATSHRSGISGDISLLSNSGEIEITGNISAVSAAYGSDSQGRSNAGNGGNISIRAENNIDTGHIFTRSFANTGDNAGSGGDVTIRSANGNVDTGLIESSTFARSDRAVGGGDVAIAGQNITVNGINTTARAIDSNAGTGGSIEIEAENSAIVNGEIKTFSYARTGSGSGKAGDIDISGRTVQVSDRITAYSIAANNAGQGGHITINAKDEIEAEAEINTYSSVRGGSNASSGGTVAFSAGTISVNRIDTSSQANEDASNAGEVTLFGPNRLSVEDIIATSAGGGSSADITLASNDLTFTGGESSLNGASVWLKPAGSEVDIALGGLSMSTNPGQLVPTLDILRTDLKSIGTAEAIRIGRADSTGNITVRQGATNGLGTSLPISILGGKTLTGPDNSNYQFDLTGTGQGEILGSNRLTFFNIENLVGGNQNDTFLVSAGVFPGGFNSISGGEGSNTLSYEQVSGSFITDLRDLNITDIQQVVGNDNDNTLRGFDSDNRWTLDGTNQGSVNEISFSGFSNLAGGSGEDTFDIRAEGELTGVLSGGAGSNDVIEYGAHGGEALVNVDSREAAGLASFIDIERINGGSANTVAVEGGSGDDVLLVTGDRAGTINNDLAFLGIHSFDGQGGKNIVSLQGLTGADDGNWRIAGENSGSVNGIDFSNVSELLGGVGKDTFEFVNNGELSGGLDGSLGKDSLDYSEYQQAVDVVIGASDVVAPGVSSVDDVERITGSAFSDVLRSAAGNSTFMVEGRYSGSVDGVSFSDFERVEGSENSVDRLDYRNYSEAIEIDLEAGHITDSLAFGNIEEIVGSAADSDVVKGRIVDDRFVRDEDSGSVKSGAIAFFDIEAVDGGLGNNTLGLEGREGQWTVEGRNSGEVNGLRFENFGRLEGSDRNDTFDIQPEGEITSGIEGREGTDTLTYADYDASVSIDLAENNSTAVGSFKEIENVVGSQLGEDSIAGSSGDDSFEIMGDRTGTINSRLTFSDIEKLEGGEGNDTFVFDNLTTASGIGISGGEAPGESNTVKTNAANTIWTITEKNAGILSQAGVTLTDFSQIQNIQNTSAEGGNHDVLFNTSTARITGSIDSGRSNLTLIGDSIEIGDRSENNNSGSRGRIAGTGRLTVQPSSPELTIELGGNGNIDSNELSIDERELEAIEDGFIEIAFGTEQQTGDIRFLDSVDFEPLVTLKTQGKVEILNNRQLISTRNINIEANDAVNGGTVISRRGSIAISSSGNIQLDETSSGGGDVTITSTTGSVSVLDKVASNAGTSASQEDRAVSGNVEIVAEQAIAIGNIITASSRRSGDVTLTAATGSIAARGIDTNNRPSAENGIAEASGSVNLSSPGSIQIEFIDAQGSGNNTDSTSIRVDTEGDFTATGSIGTDESGRKGASISTRDAKDGQIYIRYGSSDRLANPFTIGNGSVNGTAFGIETPQVTLFSGGLFSYDEGDGIEIVSNGIIPINTSLEAINKDSNVPDFRLVSAGSERAATATLQQVESRSNEEFGNYLGIGNNARTKAATLSDVQTALADVEQATGVQPALVYAYFVPDAASEEAVGGVTTLQEDSANRTLRSEDQLEIMVITPEGVPTVRRQWGVTRGQVEDAGSALRQKATSQFSAAQEYLAPAQQLYDWIITPIASTLKQQGTESLGFVMDSGLRTLPVAALHDGDRYLVEKYSLGLLPSFSLTNIDTSTRDRADFRESQVLAMGASEFENQPDLPAVDAEVSLISEGLWNGDVFLNEDFILENLQKQLQTEDYGILHLATHASFESGDLENSYIQLWNERLSLNRISDLSLEEENLGLIILSACNTALGDQAAEYGFAGLAVSSGSQSALASIWPVSDEGTLGFMTQFYGELRTSSVKAEALRQAQIRMIRGEVGIVDGDVYGPDNEILTTIPVLAESGQWDFSHPFYWSAFTMIGNPW